MSDEGVSRHLVHQLLHLYHQVFMRYMVKCTRYKVKGIKIWEIVDYVTCAPPPTSISV